ncbi:permease [Erwinia sp. CPCC 100877]|nr:permease [Erwinia sp. CPCC 100877]
MKKNLITTDFLKIKNKGLWLLVLLGPVGIVGLQVLNYALRKDYLFQLTDDHWKQYLEALSGFTPLTLVLGIVILTSLIATIEDETNAWKQLLGFPVSKASVYFSKYLVLLVLLVISSLLLLILTYLHGISLGLGSLVPHQSMLINSLFPLLASLPILSLQFWLALVCKNQSIPITVGVAGVLLTYSAHALPNWLFWKWPTLRAWDQPYLNLCSGVLIGLVMLILGAIDFIRRDVK